MKVVVLGAGLIGVASAWYLREAGHEVTVIDRQSEPAGETSYANGGQISTSHAEPWASPRMPATVLRWLGKTDAPLLWRMTADIHQWAWGLRFLMECRPHRTQMNTRAILKLALESRALLKELRGDLSLQYDQLTRGILHFYTNPAEFNHAIGQAALMREFGCEREVKSDAECLQIEPALRQSTIPIVGGTFTPQDESGDARQFVQNLATHCVERGVVFRYETKVQSLSSDGRVITGVQLSEGECIRAEAYVVALGSFSSLMLRPLGVRLPVFPAKGYSATIPLNSPLDSERGKDAPVVSLTDDEARLVFSRLGNRLRVAGMAEFMGYDTMLDAARCDTLMRRVKVLFPSLAGCPVDFWTGLRPSTPGNVPLVGRTCHDNLWINTGHGTLGWTMACGSGKLLADLLSGRTPAIDPKPYQHIQPMC